MRLARMWNKRSPGVAIAWRAPALNLAEGMQFGRTRLAENSVPRLRSNSHHAGEIPLDIAETDRAEERWKIVAAERADGRTGFGARL